MVAHPFRFAAALSVAGLLSVLAVTAGCGDQKKPDQPPSIQTPAASANTTTATPDLTKLPEDGTVGRPIGSGVGPGMSSSPGSGNVTPPPPTPSAGAKVHEMKKGDTLYGLARQYYGPDQGTKANVRRILDANPQLTDPNHIPVGTKITIP